MTNKGQAMIESLVLGTLILAGILFIMRLFLISQQNILVDELIERTLICGLEKRFDCATKLRNQLEEFHFRDISIEAAVERNRSTLRLSAQSGFDRLFEKESELELELQISPAK